MIKKYQLHFLVLLLLFLFSSCAKDEDDYIEISPVIVDLTKIPFEKLSDYKFFEGEMKNQIPSKDVLPYQPASSLFTDYAEKKRFVWMPKGSKATFDGTGKILVLPTGSALIKTFYYNNVLPNNTTRNIETRVMIKKENGWIFAEYVWNNEQTEAVLKLDGGFTSVQWIKNGTTQTVLNYRLPSEQQCLICHKASEKSIPIGIKPQNLNFDYVYSSGTKNQLKKWIELGYLENNMPTSINSTVDYTDTSKSLELRVRSYLDINCASCHQTNSHCDYRPMRFAFDETTNLSNMGVCVSTQDMADFPTTLGRIVSPANINKSMMYYRLNTENESYRMPLLGRSIIHKEGVALIKEWINSLQPCN